MLLPQDSQRSSNEKGTLTKNSLENFWSKYLFRWMIFGYLVAEAFSTFVTGWFLAHCKNSSKNREIAANGYSYRENCRLVSRFLSVYLTDSVFLNKMDLWFLLYSSLVDDVRCEKLATKSSQCKGMESGEIAKLLERLFLIYCCSSLPWMLLRTIDIRVKVVKVYY